MKYLLLILITGLFFLTSCKEDPTEPPPSGPKNENEITIMEGWNGNEGSGIVRVMSRNIYIGGDVDVVLEAEEVTDIPLLVLEVYNTMNQTDFPTRAIRLAEEIEKADPHLIGLQEVTRIYTQSPGDFLLGNPVPAEDLEYDFLQLLLDALQDKGLNYVVAHKIENADVELPMFAGFGGEGEVMLDDVRIIDQDVILARSDVQVTKKQHKHYEVFLQVPVDENISIDIPRGYVSVEAQIGDDSYVFVNTHLEAANIEQIRAAQAAELLGRYAAETLPVLMVGDFNTPAPNNTTYQMVTGAGYTDSWDMNTETYSHNSSGMTFGHAADLKNESSNMVIRIDFLFVGSQMTPDYGPVVVLGDEVHEKINGLWPSDHAGVVTQLEF